MDGFIHLFLTRMFIKEKSSVHLLGCTSADWPQGGSRVPVFAQTFSASVASAVFLCQISAATRNHGAKTGARELLGRIVRGRPGWFSKFLSILLETEHKKLYSELTGCSPDCDKQGD